MEKAPKLVRICPARSATESRILGMILTDAGIPAYVNGTLCQDEFAMSQMVIRPAADILVPEEFAERALAVLEANRAENAGAVEPAADTGPQRKSMLAAIGVTGLFGPLGLIYVMGFDAALKLWIVMIVAVVAVGVVAPEHLDDIALEWLLVLLYYLVSVPLAVCLARRHNRRLDEDEARTDMGRPA